MEKILSAEDIVRIDKSNRAMALLATLPADQRSTLIHGIAAAMQLSGTQLADIKQRTVAFAWWSDSPDE